MKVIHAIELGFFILVLAYLMLKNPQGVSSVFVGAKVGSIDEIKALQGRPVQYA